MQPELLFVHVLYFTLQTLHCLLQYHLESTGQKDSQGFPNGRKERKRIKPSFTCDWRHLKIHQIWSWNGYTWPLLSNTVIIQMLGYALYAVYFSFFHIFHSGMWWMFIWCMECARGQWRAQMFTWWSEREQEALGWLTLGEHLGGSLPALGMAWVSGVRDALGMYLTLLLHHVLSKHDISLIGLDRKW